MDVQYISKNKWISIEKASSKIGTRWVTSCVVWSLLYILGFIGELNIGIGDYNKWYNKRKIKNKTGDAY